jgi:hypothetical protein
LSTFGNSTPRARARPGRCGALRLLHNSPNCGCYELRRAVTHHRRWERWFCSRRVMAGKTFNGTYVNGITLSNPATELPATITAVGYVTNIGTANNGTALLGKAAAAWTIGVGFAQLNSPVRRRHSGEWRDRRAARPAYRSAPPSPIVARRPKIVKKNGRNSKVPAKFEQGGFTSGRRKGPKTLFPGTSPGNPYRRPPSPKTFGGASPRMRKMVDCTRIHHPEFPLARLQKAQCSTPCSKHLVATGLSCSGPRPPCAAESRGTR